MINAPELSDINAAKFTATHSPSYEIEASFTTQYLIGYIIAEN